MFFLLLGVGLCASAGEKQPNNPPDEPRRFFRVPLVVTTAVDRCAEKLGEEATRQNSPLLRLATSFMGSDGASFTLGLVGSRAYVFQDGLERVGSTMVPQPVVFNVGLSGLPDGASARVAVAPAYLPAVAPGGLVAIVERGNNRINFQWPALPAVARRRGADAHQPVLPDLSQGISHVLSFSAESVQAVALLPIQTPCCVRVFLLTDSSVYVSDLNPRAKTLDEAKRGLDFERNRFANVGGKFIQAVGPESVVVVSETGQVSFVQKGKVTPLVQLNFDHLLDFAAISLGPADPGNIELWAIGKPADKDRVLIYHSPARETKREVRAFPEQLPPDEVPIGIAASGVLLSNATDFRQGQLTWLRAPGQGARWVTRVLLSTRRRIDDVTQRYTVRGLVPVGEGKLAWLAPNWTLVEPDNSYATLMGELGEIAGQASGSDIDRLSDIIAVLRSGLGSQNDFSRAVTDDLHQLLRLLRYRRATLVPQDSVAQGLFPSISDAEGKTLAMFLLRESVAEALIALAVNERLLFEDREEVESVGDVLKQTTAAAIEKLRQFQESKRGIPDLIHDLIGVPVATTGRRGTSGPTWRDVDYLNEAFFVHARAPGHPNPTALLFHRLMAARLGRNAFEGLTAFLAWVEDRSLRTSTQPFWQTLVRYLTDTDALPWGTWDPENMRLYLMRHRTVLPSQGP